MSKYHFRFETKSGETIIEYETDIEPPSVGDIVRFDKFAGYEDEDAIYIVTDRWYTPEDQYRVNMIFTLLKTDY